MGQCPICFTELEVRDCGPCDDCGWDVPKEIEHLKDRIHTYNAYDIYEGLRLTLCDFCLADFVYYESKYFGLNEGQRLNLQDFKFVRQVDNPQVIKDKFCPECSRRLKFLNFVRTLDN